MKKALTICFLLCFMLVLCGCNKKYNIQGAERIELFFADTAEEITITDKDEITQITDQINAISFKKESSGSHATGWSFNIRWYDVSGEEIESIFFYDGQTISYDNSVWVSESGSVSIPGH